MGLDFNYVGYWPKLFTKAYEGGLLLFVFAHSENVFSALRFLLSLVHFDMFFIYTALHMVNHQNLWNVLVYKPYH